MGAFFAWLDASENERRKVYDVIDLLAQPETVDELGLGSVRDTIADALSPGTSTIQTRARYFFFVPWAYLRLEKSPAGAGGTTNAARNAEVALIKALGAAADLAGVIGIQAGAALRRLPSAIYWAGLGRLGFRLYNGGRDQYHRVLDRGARASVRDESGDLGLDGPLRGNWHPHIPEAPSRFPEGATFDLTPKEAAFFSDQLRMHAGGSLTEFLVSLGEPVIDLEYPWLHPALPQMPAALQQWLMDAQSFSELMYGAQILYNLMLARKKEKPELVTTYETALTEWGAMVTARRSIYSRWKTTEFWLRLKNRNPGLPQGAKDFCTRWMELVLASSDPTHVGETTQATELILQREVALKRGRARLKSQAHLDLWSGASNAEPLNYRWRITQTVVNDIVSGLRREVGGSKDA